MKSKYQWDIAALVPEVIEVDFAKLTDKEEPQEVKFYEFTRTDLTTFVEESLALKVIETEKDGTPKKDEQNNEIRKPFRDVEKEHSAFLFKWLAVGTRNAKKADYFEKLPLTATAIAALVNMLLKLNHVDEVLATSGNWLMLPTVMEFLAAADEKSNESANPNVTSPA